MALFTWQDGGKAFLSGMGALLKLLYLPAHLLACPPPTFLGSGCSAKLCPTLNRSLALRPASHLAYRFLRQTMTAWSPTLHC